MTVIREIVLLLSVFCALFGNAQTSLSDRLYKILVSQDIDLGLNLYREITLTDIQQLPDSSLFNYHYLGGWCNSEISNHEKAIEHCLEAKHLCESHLGILNYEYMEIMVVMGREYKALGKYEDALAIYEEGLVKSHYARKSVTVPYCSLIMGIIDCLELMGWFNEIPALLSDAWFFWDKDETPLVTYTYYPLWYLEQIYKRYGMHENALLVSAEIESFIKSKGGENHPELAEALYFKGNILDEMNRTDDSIKAFQEGLEILSGNGLENSELYGMLAGNLFIALISSACFEEGDDLLERIQQYSITNSTNTYRKALLSAANIVGAICNYDKALRYNDILLTSNITDEEKSVVENQRNNILYNQEVVENLPSLEKTFASLPIGQDDWFETGCKLSSAYYIVKAVDKNLDVLNQMYQAINLNKAIGSDYCLWILDNLYGVSIDKELYQDALRYAIEKNDYLSTLSDVPDNYRYNALNDLVVAKMRSNTLDGIDSDLNEIEKFYRERYGEISNEYAIYLHNRGRTYQLQNKLDEAKTTLLRSITIQNKVGGNPLDRTVKFYMEVERQLGEL